MKATKYVRDKLDAALRDIDAKAKWLATKPKGRNYDARAFRAIVPLCVTPFVEFIPSQFEWYWLRKGVPRVLTPNELERELAVATDTTMYFNSFHVRETTAQASDRGGTEL